MILTIIFIMDCDFIQFTVKFYQKNILPKEKLKYISEFINIKTYIHSTVFILPFSTNTISIHFHKSCISL